MTVMPSSALRTTGLVATWIGAIGSLALMLRNGRNTPRLLLVGFVFWVLSPYVALLWANRYARRWPAAMQTVLFLTMIVVAAGSLLVYGIDSVKHLRPQAAFAYVLVPPVCWILSAVAIGMAALATYGHSEYQDTPNEPRE